MNAAPRSSRGPLLSVVIPAKDSSRWLDDLLSSVLAQSIADIEILVVDNGSEDGTERLVREYELAHPQVRVLHSDATSAAGVRNAGVAAAKGRYLVFADSDDIVPDGAYKAMIESLESSGSDMVIGNHLKFSSTNTWSPTRRWYPFDKALSSASPHDVPELLSGRACWNRMFLRSFWDRADLRFPEVQSVEDIEPMTRAFVAAARIDVTDACVYLYRDRGDSSSLSVGAGAAVTTRYLEQELACLELVKDDPQLRAKHGEIVLDADGWAHLHRFLASDPGEEAVADVAAATARLLANFPLNALERVAPIRRMLWELVLGGEWAAARNFVLKSAGGSEGDVVDAWTQALPVLLGRGRSFSDGLLQTGFLRALINGAEHVDPALLRERLMRFGDTEFEPTGNALSDAMAVAVRSADAERVAAVSGLRRLVPLVIDEVEASERGLALAGPVRLDQHDLHASLRLTGAAGGGAIAAISSGPDRWRAQIPAAGIAADRYSVSVEFEGIQGRFPVVTARMPLPPVPKRFPLQPLADRKDSWRFLIDRRPELRSRLGRLLARATRKLR